MGLWGRYDDCWYRIREYYFSSRKEGRQKTDEEYYEELCYLSEGIPITAVIVDPSAASFMECIRRHGRYKVIPARNDVMDGIRKVSDAMRMGRIKISPDCRDILREFGLYRWDRSAQKDTPKKENDHAMDDMRYFVSTVLYGNEDEFFAMATKRKS